MKLPLSFYRRPDVVQIAKDLIGKYIFTRIDGEVTSGIIIETEAYEGATDRASHAYGNRRTARTEVMFAEGGVAYVYLCYGVHSLFNIVTNKKGIPHAILLRGIFPVGGIEVMKRRAMKTKIGIASGIGPGNASKLLGIHYSLSGTDLMGGKIWLEDRGLDLSAEIITGQRIGIAYAGPDALLPYRFYVRPEKIRA